MGGGWPLEEVGVGVDRELYSRHSRVWGGGPLEGCEYEGMRV